MKSKTKLLASLALFSAALPSVVAQTSTNASGGDALGSGGTVAYSVGQVVYTTNNGSSGTVAQGVQHAYEIYTVGVRETSLAISLTVFPNPTADYLTLQISDYNNEKLSYRLFDLQGKLLKDNSIDAQQTTIDMQHLAQATYFMEIVDAQNQKIQTFKIIKN